MRPKQPKGSRALSAQRRQTPFLLTIKLKILQLPLYLCPLCSCSALFITSNCMQLSCYIFQRFLLLMLALLQQVIYPQHHCNQHCYQQYVCGLKRLHVCSNRFASTLTTSTHIHPSFSPATGRCSSKTDNGEHRNILSLHYDYLPWQINILCSSHV